MHRRLRRFARRFAALAPVLAALGGQALAASSLRAPFLPHAGTTPAPLFPSPGAPAAPGTPSSPGGATASAATEAGIATLRSAVAAAGRPDLEARLAALLVGGPRPAAPVSGPSMSFSRDIEPPGAGRSGDRTNQVVTP